MGYVELKPAPTKVGAPPASSPMPSSAVATETTAATPSKTETGDHEPSETVKPVTKVEVAPTAVTPKTDGKGSSALSAKAPPFVPTSANTPAKAHDTAPLPPSSRSSFSQPSSRTATDVSSRGANAAVKGEDGVSTKPSNADSEVCSESAICF